MVEEKLKLSFKTVYTVCSSSRWKTCSSYCACIKMLVQQTVLQDIVSQLKLKSLMDGICSNKSALFLVLNNNGRVYNSISTSSVVAGGLPNLPLKMLDPSVG